MPIYKSLGVFWNLLFGRSLSIIAFISTVIFFSQICWYHLSLPFIFHSSSWIWLSHWDSLWLSFLPEKRWWDEASNSLAVWYRSPGHLPRNSEADKEIGLHVGEVMGGSLTDSTLARASLICWTPGSFRRKGFMAAGGKRGGTPSLHCLVCTLQLCYALQSGHQIWIAKL